MEPCGCDRSHFEKDSNAENDGEERDAKKEVIAAARTVTTEGEPKRDRIF